MVALLLYAYARGNRSSRGIERSCWEDVAYKVITGMRTPDHSTIAEFRRRHEPEIAELFDDVLGLCREAGLVSVGVIMIDGTKIKANASMDQNRSYREVVAQILREAEETDRREDELYGDARGDELPEQLRTARRPQGRVGEAKRRIAERKGRAIERGADRAETLRSIRSWCSVVVGGAVAGVSGSGSRAANSMQRRAREGAADPARSRGSLFQALGRLEQNHRVDLAVNEVYEHWRATARDTKGRVLKGNSKPFVVPELPDGRINLSDPDSRVMRTKGYPAPAGLQRAGRGQRAADHPRRRDHGRGPGLRAAGADAEHHARPPRPARCDRATGRGVADAGYWHTRQIETLTERGFDVLVPPDGAMREGKRPAGRTAYTRTCETNSKPSAAAGSTSCARSRSSRSTARSNTTAVSTSSCEEAEPPRSQSGGWSQQPTTS